jgi:hypothetical protein
MLQGRPSSIVILLKGRSKEAFQGRPFKRAARQSSAHTRGEAAYHAQGLRPDTATCVRVCVCVCVCVLKGSALPPFQIMGRQGGAGGQGRHLQLVHDLSGDVRDMRKGRVQGMWRCEGHAKGRVQGMWPCEG